ncbi:MAG: hypothetical protein ACI4J0_11405 [Huintestinicola sp.]|uniref:hypothetical protein n=1 Tax=Huintestinicola sp. TaxID=2981661 RepID=UPI003F0BF0B7
MSMKLSYRDKVIIIVVSVLVVLGVGIFCFAKPKYEDLQVSKERLAAKEDEKAQVEAKMGTLEELKKQLENNIKAVVEDQEQFLSEKEYGDTYQISKYLMELLSPAGDFKITGVTLDPLSSTVLDAYYYNKSAVAYPMKVNGDIANKLPPEVGYVYNNNYPAPPAGVAVGGTVATVEYECENSVDLLNAVQLIADNDKNIYLLTFSGSYIEDPNADPEDPKFSGELTIQIYEIYPLDPEDVDDVPAALSETASETAAE